VKERGRFTIGIYNLRIYNPSACRSYNRAIAARVVGYDPTQIGSDISGRNVRARVRGICWERTGVAQLATFNFLVAKLFLRPVFIVSSYFKTILVRGKNDFAEGPQILLDTDLKIILLEIKK